MNGLIDQAARKAIGGVEGQYKNQAMVVKPSSPLDEIMQRLKNLTEEVNIMASRLGSHADAVMGSVPEEDEKENIYPSTNGKLGELQLTVSVLVSSFNVMATQADRNLKLA